MEHGRRVGTDRCRHCVACGGALGALLAGQSMSEGTVISVVLLVRTIVVNVIRNVARFLPVSDANCLVLSTSLVNF